MRILFLISLIGMATAHAAELSTADFMRQVRTPQTAESCFAVTGQAEHLRRGSNPETAPVYFALIIQKARMTGQILIGQDEGFLIGQTRQAGNGESTMVPLNRAKSGENSLLGRMGIDPSDLAMNFLYYDVVKELPPDRVRMIPCRVVLLKSPDGKRLVRVSIARKELFPLKAEFFNGDSPSEKPFRTLEVSAFAEKNHFCYASELSIFGPGWRSRIHFDDPLIIGPYRVDLAQKLFRKLGETK